MRLILSLFLASLLAHPAPAEASVWNWLCGLVGRAAQERNEFDVAWERVYRLFPKAQFISVEENTHFSIVYEVITAKGEKFAVKVPAKKDRDGKERIAAEYAVLKKVSQRSDRVLNPVSFKSGKPPALVTPFYENGNLPESFARFGPDADFKILHRAMLDAAEAVGAVHAEGWVHNDIKPGNFLVEIVNGIPRLVLMDFGIAAKKGEFPIGVDPGMRWARGTPGYRDKRQESNWESHPESDLFALSVTYQEILAGNILSEPDHLTSPHGRNRKVNPYLSAISRHQFTEASQLIEMLGHAKEATEQSNPALFFKPFGKILESLPVTTETKAKILTAKILESPELVTHYPELELSRDLNLQIRYHFRAATGTNLP